MSTSEYKREKYDRLVFLAAKGKGAEYQQVAADLGLGQAEMYRLAVEEFIARHAGGDFLPVVKPAPLTPPPEKLSGRERTLVDEFNRLPSNAQDAITRTIRAFNAQNRNENHDTD